MLSPDEKKIFESHAIEEITAYLNHPELNLDLEDGTVNHEIAVQIAAPINGDPKESDPQSYVIALMFYHLPPEHLQMGQKRSLDYLLLYFAWWGEADKCDYCIRLGANVNARLREISVLNYAIDAGSSELVHRLLAEPDLDPNALNYRFDSPIVESLQADCPPDIALALLLDPRCQLTGKGRFSPLFGTPLCAAIHFEREDCVHELLALEGTGRIILRQEMHALLLSIKRGSRWNFVMDALLDAGVDVNGSAVDEALLAYWNTPRPEWVDQEAGAETAPFYNSPGPPADEHPLCVALCTKNQRAVWVLQERGARFCPAVSLDRLALDAALNHLLTVHPEAKARILVSEEYFTPFARSFGAVCVVELILAAGSKRFYVKPSQGSGTAAVLECFVYQIFEHLNGVFAFQSAKFIKPKYSYEQTDSTYFALCASDSEGIFIPWGEAPERLNPAFVQIQTLLLKVLAMVLGMHTYSCGFLENCLVLMQTKVRPEDMRHESFYLASYPPRQDFTEEALAKLLFVMRTGEVLPEYPVIRHSLKDALSLSLKAFPENKIIAEYSESALSLFSQLELSYTDDVRAYFQAYLARTSKILTHIEYSPKLSGKMPGAVATLVYDDGGCAATAQYFYKWTEAKPRYQTAERLQELFCYKLFEHAGFGPECHYFIHTMSGRSIIATREVAGLILGSSWPEDIHAQLDSTLAALCDILALESHGENYGYTLDAAGKPRLWIIDFHLRRAPPRILSDAFPAELRDQLQPALDRAYAEIIAYARDNRAVLNIRTDQEGDLMWLINYLCTYKDQVAAAMQASATPDSHRLAGPFHEASVVGLAFEDNQLGK
jgi:hypothetical protein